MPCNDISNLNGVCPGPVLLYHITTIRLESTEIHGLYLLMPYDLTKGWIYSRGAHPCWPRSTGVQKNQMHSRHQQ
jgi:hypothetical protein